MRKLLGYRLKEEKYREAARSITDSSLIRGSKDWDFVEGSYAHIRAKKAGVMHWFEEVYEEEKLEVWKWYRDKTCGAVIIYFSGNRKKGNYGFNRAGEWTNEYSIHNTPVSDYRKATTEEIQQALIKEATKRYPVPCKLRYLDTGVDSMGGYVLDYNEKENALSASGFGKADFIFKDGKWAEILPTETLNGKTAIIDGVEYELKIKD